MTTVHKRSKNIRFIVMTGVLSAVSAVLMLVCGVVMKLTKWKWINDYELPICMVVAMALAIPISDALGG